MATMPMIRNTIAEGGKDEPWHFHCRLTSGDIVSLPFIGAEEDFIILDLNAGSGPNLKIRIGIQDIVWSVVDRECTTMHPVTSPAYP